VAIPQRKYGPRLAGYLIVLTGLCVICAVVAESAKAMSVHAKRRLYAVSKSPGDPGSVPIYDIDEDHRLIKSFGRCQILAM
jgi:hypothetical protein